MLSKVLPSDRLAVIRLSEGFQNEKQYQFKNVEEFENSKYWLIAFSEYELRSIKINKRQVSIRYTKKEKKDE